jgi:hypothetical protein
MLNQLKQLQQIDILGIKCETEAEGSSFEDVWKLYSATAACDLPLHWKIGGCEAINDIHKAYQIGVEGIIVPMVETDFAVYKFLKSINQVYKNEHIDLTINIETKAAIENLQSILDITVKHDTHKRIKGITIGRSDLSASYFNPNIVQDSDFILDKIKDVIEKCKPYNLKIAVGGNFNQNSLEKIQRDTYLVNNLYKVETRKVMFSPKIKDSNLFQYIFDFESSCLKWKQDINNLQTQDTDIRINILKQRYGL